MKNKKLFIFSFFIAGSFFLNHYTIDYNNNIRSLRACSLILENILKKICDVESRTESLADLSVLTALNLSQLDRLSEVSANDWIQNSCLSQLKTELSVVDDVVDVIANSQFNFLSANDWAQTSCLEVLKANNAAQTSLLTTIEGAQFDFLSANDFMQSACFDQLKKDVSIVDLVVDRIENDITKTNGLEDCLQTVKGTAAAIRLDTEDIQNKIDNTVIPELNTISGAQFDFLSANDWIQTSCLDKLKADTTAQFDFLSANDWIQTSLLEHIIANGHA